MEDGGGGEDEDTRGKGKGWRGGGLKYFEKKQSGRGPSATSLPSLAACAKAGILQAIDQCMLASTDFAK